MSVPSDETVALWTALSRAQRRVLRAVEAALKATALPPLEWYDVLLELDRGPALRPRELRARLLLAQPNLSRLLDRMEAAGLVERTACEEDRRGQLVSITSAGRDLRRRVWPVYAAALQAALGPDGPEGARIRDELARRLS